MKLSVSIPLLLITLGCSLPAFSNTNYGINLDNNKVCQAVNDKLGQLLMVNVDGFGNGVEQAIHPDYIKLVKRLNIGGVVPQFGKRDPQKIYQATQQLFSATEIPLLMGVDGTKVSYTAAESEQTVRVGFRSSAGWMAHYQANNKPCFEQQSFLDAFLHKALGLNIVLGPTVEQNRYYDVLFKRHSDYTQTVDQLLTNYRNLGVNAAIKAFPFHLSANNRVPPKLSRGALMEKLEIYRYLAPKSQLLITSHLGKSAIDPDERVTFSRTWIDLLKNQLGYKGLIVTDTRRFMKANQAKLTTMVPKWLKRHPQDPAPAAFVARAIIAGHDLVVLQGTSRDTIGMFEALSIMACRDDQDGARLRYRIEQSYEAIVKFKNENKGALSYRPAVDPQLLKDILAYKHKLDSQKQCHLEQSDSFEFLNLKQRVFETN